jgi:hypothetical protein
MSKEQRAERAEARRKAKKSTYLVTNESFKFDNGEDGNREYVKGQLIKLSTRDAKALERAGIGIARASSLKKEAVAELKESEGIDPGTGSIHDRVAAALESDDYHNMTALAVELDLAENRNVKKEDVILALQIWQEEQ